jgi:hypothetical protein
MKLAAALLACMAIAAQAQKTPDPANARPPYPAIQPGDDNVVTYPAPGGAEAESNGNDAALHEKVEGKVVIHPGDQTGYNASGEAGGDDSCCRVCPKRENCADDEHCFSECFKKCGPECNIPNNVPKCVIGVDCGMVAGNESQDGSNNVIIGSKIHDKDMVEGYETKKSSGLQKSAKPIKGQERPPLPALEAGNGGGALKEKPDTGIVPGEVAPVPATPAKPPAPKISVNVVKAEGGPEVNVETAGGNAAGEHAADASRFATAFRGGERVDGQY